MDIKQRNGTCPKCDSHLLARDGKFIFCLESHCNWAVQGKRKEDETVPDVHILIDNWK